MVRVKPCAELLTRCSPHPRGDGPSLALNRWMPLQFSPPAWGWSVGNRAAPKRAVVLPTRVGMVRMVSARRVQALRSPHPRGDGPLAFSRFLPHWAFSPPAWGWSVRHPENGGNHPVLPTRGGDGPWIPTDPFVDLLFSPPAWGWSVASLVAERLRQVLPTRVGMVRTWATQSGAAFRSPHPRGDGPYYGLVKAATLVFSPPAWGWSGLAVDAGAGELVLPTRVGMVRPTPASRGLCRCSPHPRGDGPLVRQEHTRRVQFSPPAWGWSAGEGVQRHPSVVLPTRVGMVRLRSQGRRLA